MQREERRTDDDCRQHERHRHGGPQRLTLREDRWRLPDGAERVYPVLAIGVVQPVSLNIETFGTEKEDPERIQKRVLDAFDKRWREWVLTLRF